MGEKVSFWKKPLNYLWSKAKDNWLPIALIATGAIFWDNILVIAGNGHDAIADVLS